MSSDSAIWSGTYYGGIAIVLAANVGFGAVGGWIAAGVVMGVYVLVFRRMMRTLDEAETP